MALTYDKPVNPVNEVAATEAVKPTLVEDTQNNVSSKLEDTKEENYTVTEISVTEEDAVENTKNMKIFLETIERPIADGRALNDEELVLVTGALNQVYEAPITDAQFKAKLVLAASWLMEYLLSDKHLNDTIDSEAGVQAILLTIESLTDEEYKDPAAILISIYSAYKNELADIIAKVAKAKADTVVSSLEETTLTSEEAVVFKEVVEQPLNEELKDSKDSNVSDDVVESIIDSTVEATIDIKEESEDIASATRSMYADAMKSTSSGSGGSYDTNWVGIGLGAIAIGAIAYAGYCYFSDDGCDTIIVE